MAIRVVNPINGTSGDDTINGTAMDDWISGGGGTDTIYGNSGNDILSGGFDGKVDKIFGGEGVDTVYYADAPRDMTIDLNTNSGAGFAKLNAVDVQTTIGGHTITVHFAEVMEDELHDVENVTAGSGNDTILGNSGANRLYGGDGNDVIDGRGNDDVLLGGKGTDVLTGGTGADTFVFQSVNDSNGQFGEDRIMDFVHGSDKIDLSAIDADVTTAGDQAFRLVPMRLEYDNGHYHFETGFTGHAGELTVAANVSSLLGTIYVADVDGDAVADMTFFVNSSGALTSSDFLL